MSTIAACHATGRAARRARPRIGDHLVALAVEHGPIQAPASESGRLMTGSCVLEGRLPAQSQFNSTSIAPWVFAIANGDACLACGSDWRVVPRLVRAHWQVHPPAGAARSRPFVTDGPLRRGSFALGAGRSPRRKPHVPCMWKRLAGRPTAGAGPSPPRATSRRCKVASLD